MLDGPVLLISPHCDDAVFSLGGALLHRHLRNVTVLDVFTRSNYTAIGIRDVEGVTKERLAEEGKVMQQLSVGLEVLSFDDASIRPPYWSDDYLNPSLDPRADEAWMGVRESVRAFVSQRRFSLILAPLGLGHHIDHRITAEVGKELAVGRSVAFYEDGSYDDALQEDSIFQTARGHGLSLQSWVFRFRDVHSKLQLCKKYKSQVNDQILNTLEMACRLREGERIWASAEDILRLRLG